MKKKFLLTIIPALMILSACAGAQPRQEAVQQEPEFVEDTLAHEEIFGNAGKQIKLTPYKEPAVPSDPSLRKPLVGVQYKDEGGGKYAIRYVAAIAALDVEATWTRGISDEHGTQQLTGDSKFVVKPVTYAYTAVSADSGSGDAYTTPEAVDENFHYFVVYTLRNVPSSHLNSYLFAYLTLTKGVESVKSLARVTRISGGNTFTLDVEERSGYFLQGTINGSSNAFLTVDDDGGEDYYIKEDDFELQAGDNFGLFKVASDHFQCFGYCQYDRQTPFVEKKAASNYAKVYTSGTYSISLDKSNKIALTRPVGAEARVYLKPGSNWKGNNAWFALYVYKAANTSDNKWYKMNKINDDYYYVTVDLSYDRFIFCRMNKDDTDTLNWSNKWNQTQDLWYEVSNYTDNMVSLPEGDWSDTGSWSVYES